MAYGLVIFDFDGTLVDSERCIHAAMTAALQECGIPGDLSRLKRQIGMPLDDSVRGLVDVELDDATVGRVIESYRRHHRLLQHDLIRLYPRVADALGDLAAAGVQLAIASSKLSTAVRETLAQFELAPLFDEIVGGEQVVRGKPDPEMIDEVLTALGRGRDETLFVGDTVFDVAMARNAGIDSCAVTYGNQTLEQISSAHPRYIANSIDEVVLVALRRLAP